MYERSSGKAAPPDTSSLIRPPNARCHFENTSLDAIECLNLSDAGTGLRASTNFAYSRATETDHASNVTATFQFAAHLRALSDSPRACLDQSSATTPRSKQPCPYASTCTSPAARKHETTAILTALYRVRQNRDGLTSR